MVTHRKESTIQLASLTRQLLISKEKHVNDLHNYTDNRALAHKYFKYPKHLFPSSIHGYPNTRTTSASMILRIISFRSSTYEQPTMTYIKLKC